MNRTPQPIPCYVNCDDSWMRIISRFEGAVENEIQANFDALNGLGDNLQQATVELKQASDEWLPFVVGYLVTDSAVEQLAKLENSNPELDFAFHLHPIEPPGYAVLCRNQMGQPLQEEVRHRVEKHVANIAN